MSSWPLIFRLPVNLPYIPPYPFTLCFHAPTTQRAIRWGERGGGLDVRASTFFTRHCRRDVLTSLLLRLVFMQRGPPLFASVWHTCHTKCMEHRRRQRCLLDPSIHPSRITTDSRSSVTATGPEWNVHHPTYRTITTTTTTSPTTAAYGSGQQPSIVPLPFSIYP